MVTELIRLASRLDVGNFVRVVNHEYQIGNIWQSGQRLLGQCPQCCISA